MIRHLFAFRDTFATILADEDAHVAAAKEAMIAARQDVERCIARDPYFRITFAPYDPGPFGRTVGRMVHAAAQADVGPMAAVAGAIAWAGAEAMQDAGASFGVVDNGGDIALLSDREVPIGIHAGEAGISDRYAFAVPPQDRILGIATSSATVGPSISLGVADAVTVFSSSPAAADAWASAICNRIRADDHAVFGDCTGTDVSGVCAVLGDTILHWGTVPPIVPASVPRARIAAGVALSPQDSALMDRNASR
jgi:ApbE superfamily uncharacterized protein (UPF0280 family)